MASMQSKSVLVTGGNRGLGLAVARAFVAAGAKVAVAGRDLARCEEAVKGLAPSSGTAMAICLDVTDPSSAETAVRRVAERFGGIDVLINNAALVGPLSEIVEAAKVLWRQTVETNLVGAFNTVAASLPYLIHSKGTIINISAGAADTAVSGMSAYCCSKAGLAMLTRCLAEEYGKDGLRVFGFRPGMLDTEMLTEVRTAKIAKVSEVDRYSPNHPDVPAAVLLRLCSGEVHSPNGSDVTWNDPAFAKAE